jgi:hypothetical protein
LNFVTVFVKASSWAQVPTEGKGQVRRIRESVRGENIRDRVPQPQVGHSALSRRALRKSVKTGECDDTIAFLMTSPDPTSLPRPIYNSKILAGQPRFPSPAQDYEQKTLDLNDSLVANPPAMLFFNVEGDFTAGANTSMAPH